MTTKTKAEPHIMSADREPAKAAHTPDMTVEITCQYDGAIVREKIQALRKFDWRGLHFAITPYESPDMAGQVRCTELTTGMAFGPHGETDPDKAMKAAIDKLESVGVRKVKQAIARGLEHIAKLQREARGQP